MKANRKSIARLIRYKNALYRFKELGHARIFSDVIADAVGVTSAQVRKDFSVFGLTGNKRGGYQVDDLLESLNGILGKDREQRVVIVGAGQIGAALMQYEGFAKEGIRIVAAFDIDPEKFGERNGIPVMPLDSLRGFIREKDIRIGISAVPDIAAQQVVDMMISSGIKGILNFAPISLKSSGDMVINNVNLALELENVIYFVNATDKDGSL